jgi:hypothetical protein
VECIGLEAYERLKKVRPEEMEVDEPGPAV